MKKKHQPTSEELKNDPSLRYHYYCRGEALWSDTMKSDVRFGHYDQDGQIVILDMVMREMGAVDPLTIRRHSIEREETASELRGMLHLLNARKKSTRGM